MQSLILIVYNLVEFISFCRSSEASGGGVQYRLASGCGGAAGRFDAGVQQPAARHTASAAGARDSRAGTSFAHTTARAPAVRFESRGAAGARHAYQCSAAHC